MVSCLACGLALLFHGLAETIGVVISFYIMRYFLRDAADKLISKSTTLMKVDDFSGNNGFVVMLFARSLPYFPSGVITALGAISKIKPRDYILANLIGKFPSTALEVAIGTDIVNFQENHGASRYYCRRSSHCIFYSMEGI